ncbi:MAG TPA: hypothetical protein VGV59_05160 [Pyrinomonadaceae bacterium]|nr:hypothetical protein [Pyrinomonadaceae bacterium]
MVNRTKTPGQEHSRRGWRRGSACVTVLFLLLAAMLVAPSSENALTHAQVRRLMPVRVTTPLAPAPEDVAVVSGAEWGRFYNGPANCCESSPFVALDASGNVFITGRSTTTRTSPGGPFNDDIATVKYDAQGNQQWARRFDAPGMSTDTPQDIQADAQGNVIITGHAVVSGGDMQFVTLKYNPNGDLQWARFAGEANGDHALALDIDAQGNVYVTGRSIYAFRPSSEPIFRVLTVKYDAQGNELWRRTYDSDAQQGAEAADVRVDGQGNVLITGRVLTPVSPSGNRRDILTLKYNAAGDLQWARTFAGAVTSAGTRVEPDGQGGVFVLGGTQVDFNNRQSDTVILHYTSAGDLVLTAFSWMPQNDNGTDWVFDSAGNIYVVGLRSIPSSSAMGTPNVDVLTLKFNAAGSLQWARTYQGVRDGTDQPRGIFLSADGASVYVAANSQNTNFNFDYVLVKYAAETGSEQAVKRFDGPDHDNDLLSDAAMDAAGNFYLTGTSDRINSSSRSVDFLTIKVGAEGPTDFIEPPEPGMIFEVHEPPPATEIQSAVTNRRRR